MTLLLLTLTIAYALLCWIQPRSGLLLLVATLPSYLLRTELFGIPTTLLELMLVTFIIIWLVKTRPQIKLHPRLLVTSYWLPITLLLLAASISLFIAPDTTAALGIYKAYFIEPVIFFLILHYEIQHKNLNPAKLLKALGISAFVLSAVALIQWLTASGIPVPWDIERRVTSVFDYPNALGLFLGPIVVIGVLSALRQQKAGQRNIWFLISSFSFVAIILAQSEAAIVAVIATLLIAGLLTRKTRKGAGIFITLLVIATLLVPSLAQKLTLQDYSGGVRLSQWSETVDLLKDNWLLGVGLSGYPSALQPYHSATQYEIFQYPHNIVLNVWTELGLLGLIGLILLSAQVIKAGYKLPVTSYQSIALFALLEMTIHGLVDVPYFKNDLAILTWILIAIIFSYAPKQTGKKTP